MIKKMPNGKYRVRRIDSMGKKICKTFQRERDAKVFEDEMKTQMRKGEYIAPRTIPTLDEKAAQWFATTAHCRPGPRNNYRARLDLWLLPTFGKLRLDRIDTQAVEKFRAELCEKTGHANVAGILSTLKHVLAMAKRHGQIRSNPVDDLPRLVVKAQEITGNDEPEKSTLDPAKVLNPAEVKQLIDAAAPGIARTLLTTAALTGCRDGELLALKWTAVDLAGATITIERSLTWARVLEPKSETGERPDQGPMRPQFYPPKTAASKRMIPIPAVLVSALRTWKLACPPSPHDLVFPEADGRPLHRSYALKRHLQPALRRAKLRHVTMHSLRHSFASTLIAQGAPVTEVQHLLGHSNPGITLRVYSHYFPTAPSGSVSKLASAILGPGHILDTSKVA
jgi:integrase